MYAFKEYKLVKPTFLGEKPANFKYLWDIEVKLFKHENESPAYLVIGQLEYQPHQEDWTFRSVGMRYFGYRKDYLDEWIMAVTKVLELEYQYEEVEE